MTPDEQAQLTKVRRECIKFLWWAAVFISIGLMNIVFAIGAYIWKRV